MKIRWIFLLMACVAVTACAATPVHYVARSKNRRYLLGMDGLPFLIAGDSPQSLMVNIGTNDADTYFADRQSHGFNTVWINEICQTYTGGNAQGSTFDGILPFTGYLPGGVNDLAHYDMTKPNEAYFARCDQMIELANKYGIVVMLDPFETGGWITTGVNNGPTRCHEYGRYLGKRYKNFPNIIWINGSDFGGWTNKAEDKVALAVAQGIRQNDKHHIHTVELKSPGCSLDAPPWASIVRLSASYTYNPTYAEVLRDYQLKKFEPVFLVEANYDAEPLNPVTTEVIRQQEYWTDLCGATGQLYGSDPSLRFPSGWQSTYDSPGAVEMLYVGQLFGPRAWYNLIPDTNHVVVTEGYGTFSDQGNVGDSDYLTAALTPDGTLMMAYMPTVRQFTVNMTKFSGPVTARWYDPTDGVYTTIDGSPMSNTGTQDFLPPGNNNNGDGDWVLVLETQPPP